MPEERRPHLFPHGTGITERYTNPRIGRGVKHLFSRNVPEHARSLVQKLQAVRQREIELGQMRRAAGIPEVTGVVLEFDSEPGHDLELESLEGPGRSVRLLSTRVHDGVVSATVFVPEGKVDTFITWVEDYASKLTKGGKPKHQPLFANLSDIRTAILDAFWTDPPEAKPRPNIRTWWEVWLRTDDTTDTVTLVKDYALAHQMSIGPSVLRFPDRSVILLEATIEQMANSAELLTCIAELRRARLRTTEFIEMPAREHAEWADELIGRVLLPTSSAPAVCILDTGLDFEHPLLADLTSESDCQSYNPEWGRADDHGHGTKMAGLSAYGDLAEVLESTARYSVRHQLESVKILPPLNRPMNPPRLYGDVVKEAVSRADVQNPGRSRVICMAVTVHPADGIVATDSTGQDLTSTLAPLNNDRGRGKPSSWSSAIDDLAAGVGGMLKRLVVLSAGNSEPALRRFYPNANLVESIHDPAQSWNALTVGAMTSKRYIDSQQFPGWASLARTGGLAPSSTTSMVWEQQWPNKPDIVMEGGNMAVDPSTNAPDYIDDLQLLTTRRRGPESTGLWTTMGDTSAATALASRLAATINAEYSQLWPETIRALVVHSAEWTNEMLDGRSLEQIRELGRVEKSNLLRTFGYGVPNTERALWSAGNALTLIIEDEIQPFLKEGNEYKTNEMRLHQLPWPRDVLASLEETVVDLRVTLSYFIEPQPGERGRTKRYSYASHQLRFDMQTAEENVQRFKRRINKALRDVGHTNDSSPDHDEWVLGPSIRFKGSVHSDRWIGTARALSTREHIAVSPVDGWWRNQHRLGRHNSRARYALVLSISAPEVDVDLYTPVAVQIRVPVPVQNIT